MSSVRAEAGILKAQGVNIIIVLSHCGIDVDYEIARNAGPDVDVIVGGHSHTFMFTGSNPPSTDIPRDEYPAVVTQADGNKVREKKFNGYKKYKQIFFPDAGINCSRFCFCEICWRLNGYI